MSILLLVIGIILFIGLVVVHEYGHFIMARRNGVEVEEFGIFFPPRIYKKKTKAGWLFTINALPLGGFVKLKGEHDTDTEPGSFGAATLWVKTKIMAAGVVMNLITALILLTIVALLGMPKLIDDQFTVKSDTQVTTNKVLIGHIEPGSPAEKAGLKINDEILDIGAPGRSPVGIKSADELPEVTKRFAGQEVKIFYVRDGKNEVAKTKLTSSQEVTKSQETFKKQVAENKLDCAAIDSPKGYLGIVPREYTLQKSTWSAPVTAVGLSAQITGLTFEGLGKALAGVGKLAAGFVTGNSTARSNGQCAASSQVSGPVGIFYVLQSGSDLGYNFILLIIAIISLSLAIMNILPIPALDGGRLWITLVARGLKKPLTPAREETINAIGFFLLILLIILITIVDVKRFF
jgi:regulator of sigma E protease